MMCYYLNVHFQGQRFKYILIFTDVCMCSIRNVAFHKKKPLFHTFGRQFSRIGCGRLMEWFQLHNGISFINYVYEVYFYLNVSLYTFCAASEMKQRTSNLQFAVIVPQYCVQSVWVIQPHVERLTESPSLGEGTTRASSWPHTLLWYRL